MEYPKLLWPLLPSLLTSGSHEFLVEPIAQEPGGDESSSQGPGQHFLSVRKVVCRDTKVVQSSQTVLSSSGLLNLPVQLCKCIGEVPRKVVLSQESEHHGLDVWNGAQDFRVGEAANRDVCDSRVLPVT